MTKNKLVKKVLSGAKKVVLGAGILGASLIYSNNVNAQTKDKFVEGAKISVLTPGGGLVEGEMQKIHGSWYSAIDDKDNKSNSLGIALVHGETMDRVGSYGGDNIVFKPNLYFLPEQAKDSSGVVAGRIELKSTGPFSVDGKKTGEIIEKSSKDGENTLYITKIGNQELLVPLYGIKLSATEFFMPFLPKDQDSLVASGKKLNFASIPSKDKEGHPSKQIVEYDGDVSLANPKDVYIWKLDETKSNKEIIENSDLLKKLMIKENYPPKEKSNMNTGECSKFLKYEEEEKEQKEEKAPSNFSGRIKAGVGFTVPSGFEASINPQVKIGEKAFLGPYVSFSNSSSSLENITQEDGFRQVVSVPAQMYFVSTGTEIKENTKVTNDFGLGLNFSYVASPNLEAFIKAGILGQKIEKTMQSTGEEYMEIAGSKEDVQTYNEINTSVTNNSLFKGSPVYVGVGAEYFPLKEKKILKNISVAGEVGYIFGENSRALGSLGIKYTLAKSKKQE